MDYLRPTQFAHSGADIAPTSPRPQEGDLVLNLLAKNLLGRVVTNIEIRSDDTDFDVDESYVSVAILSGTVTLTRADNTTVVLPSGIQTGIFNSSTFTKVEGSASCSLVIEIY